MTSQAQQIKELKEREKTVRSHWFPFPDHPTPELCGIEVRTLDGEHWAIFEQSQFAVSALVGDRWIPAWSVSSAEFYKHDRDDALELAPGLAEASAKAYTLAAAVVDEATAKPAADPVQELIEQSRAASPVYLGVA